MTIYSVRADTVRLADWTQLYQKMPHRMEKAHRFRLERDRLLCIGAGILMTEVLGLRNEDELVYGAYGKPFAPGYPDFNLSHSGEYCVLGIGQGEIGIDIEHVDSAHLNIAPEVFTTAELSWMNKNPLERFYMLWTWKESVMKATGLGLSLAPASFEVLPFIIGQPVLLKGRLLYARSGGMKNYCYSVCASYPVSDLDWAEWHPVSNKHIQ